MSDQKPVRIIEVVPHDSRWAGEYLKEAELIRRVFGEQLVEIYHIGSTAIPGIYAKPIIDFLVGVKDIQQVDSFNPQMEQLGYLAYGEFGISGRRYFPKGPVLRTHQVHIFQSGDAQIARHLNFRDYMHAHPAEAKQYEALKIDLAQRFRFDIDGYTDGKDDFIQEMDRRAAEWVKRGRVEG
ncbi:MAG: GrpB family protein [Anaerolineaceae bacterium]|nr:GrpB family protein [Anaerolineaceae bacterium]